MDDPLLLNITRDIPPDYKGTLKRPTEITHFSFDENHNFQPDRSQLKYYYDPELGVSLQGGFEKFRQIDDSHDEHLNGLLDAIMVYEKQQQKKLDADVVCFRGLMTKVMTMPYEADPFQFNATNFQGTIFIEMSNSFNENMKRMQTQDQRRSRHTPDAAVSTYWGYKFETMCLLPSTWDATPREVIEGRKTAQVSNFAQYCSIVQTGTADVKLVIGGEVDGIWDDIPTTTGTDLRPNYVELKTALIPDNHPVAQQRFERKLNKHWAQSYLLGVPRIIFGFRNRPPNPVLIKTETYVTKDIPGMVQRNGRSWEQRPCVYALEQFLAFITKHMKDQNGVWSIRRDGQSVLLKQVTKDGTGEILKKEFLDWRATFEQDQANEVASPTEQGSEDAAVW